MKKPGKKQTTVNITLLILRLAIGWVFLYAGLTKVLDPSWTAAGFLKGAETFKGLYSWFGSPQNIGWVDFLNRWGETLVGAGLITGTLTRLSCYFGMLLMALYYFPSLNFPYVEHGLIVDEHVIYFMAFAVLAVMRTGEYFGLDRYLTKGYRNWWI